MALAGCGAPSELREAEKAWERGDYIAALDYAERALSESPDNQRVRSFHRKARLRGLTQLGQRLVFLDRDKDAIAVLERALELDPYDFYAQEWISKARLKLAQRGVKRAKAHVVSGELDAAQLEFQRAIEYDPGNINAREGLAVLNEAKAKRVDRSRSEFLHGLRARAGGELAVALYHFRIAVEKDPANDQAREAMDEVRAELGRSRLETGKREEAAGSFRAALMDYEIAAEMMPDDEDIARRLEICRKEVRAEDLVGEAELQLFRGEYSEAREKLEEAFGISVQQKIDIQDLLVVAREREAADDYQVARDLELQDRFDEALEAFRALDEKMPGFRDTRAVIARLDATVSAARTAYAAGLEAEKNGEFDEALRQYVEAVIAWPTYEDVAERIERLRAMQDPQAPSPPRDGG